MLLVRGIPSRSTRVHCLGALVAFALIGSVFVSAASAASPVVLRVMEFNIEYGGEVVNFDSIVRGAQAADPDVIAVEEGFGPGTRRTSDPGMPSTEPHTDPSTGLGATP